MDWQMLYSAGGTSISHNGTLESRYGNVESALEQRGAPATALREAWSGSAGSRKVLLITLFSGFVDDSQITVRHFSVFAFTTFCSTMKCDDRSTLWDDNPIR
jgi:hypothetical protein